MQSLQHATSKVVSGGAGRHGTTAWLPRSQEPRGRTAGHKSNSPGTEGARETFEIGRPAEELSPEFRQWIIDFGSSAYVALYHFNGKDIVILAVRHGREAGY
jgi:hypothetical protein